MGYCPADRFLLATVILLSVASGTGTGAYGQDNLTPMAGEAYRTELFGEPIYVAPRDRRHVVAANLGIHVIPGGPTFYETLPFGALFVWQNDERSRFRGTFSGVFNDLVYNVGRPIGWQLLFTLQTVIIPLGRSEYVEAHRISDVDLEWNQVYAGVGLGYRTLIHPWHQDNLLEVTLSYEPGLMWFKRSSDTSPSFSLPQDTYEGRVHARFRLDGLERNLMELPHRGFATGADAWYGHRAEWGRWGNGPFPATDPAAERDYFGLAAYGLVAGGVPFLAGTRHRLIAEFHGGVGQDLDRFSAFRLPGRPTGYEWESIARPVLPGVAFNELFPRRFGIANLTYRYEALFFLYPYVRGTWGIVETPRFAQNRRVELRMDNLPALSAGVITGAPWRSQIELNYSYNFGMFRDTNGRHEEGRHAFFIFWSKQLGGD